MFERSKSFIRGATRPKRKDPAQRENEITTDEWLLRRAAALRLKAKRVLAKAQDEADDLIADAKRLEEAARSPKAADRASDGGEHYSASREQFQLPERSHRLNVYAHMLPGDHALSISKGQTKKAKKAGKAPDALVLVAQEHGYSLRGLARTAADHLKKPVPASGLSMARRGLRPIDRDVAAFIESKIGFKAIPKNWPGGFDPELD